MQVLLSKDGNSIILETPPESVRYFTELALNNPEVSITFNPPSETEGYATIELYRIVPIQSQYSPKIKAIKLLRELTGWGLTESKDFIESPGSIFKCHKSQIKRAIRQFREYGYEFEPVF